MIKVIFSQNLGQNYSVECFFLHDKGLKLLSTMLSIQLILKALTSQPGKKIIFKKWIYSRRVVEVWMKGWMYNSTLFENREQRQPWRTKFSLQSTHFH